MRRPLFPWLLLDGETMRATPLDPEECARIALWAFARAGVAAAPRPFLRVLARQHCAVPYSLNIAHKLRTGCTLGLLRRPPRLLVWIRLFSALGLLLVSTDER